MKKRHASLMILALFLCILLFTSRVQSIKAEPSLKLNSTIASETHVEVPFYYQEKDYYCGPAALQMVFNYYGENVSQYEIADVARTIGYPSYSTYTDELRRAGHFSNISTSMGDEMPENITGYSLRELGYAAFESQGMNLTTLESFINQSKPLILLMWYSSYHASGHFRVATGYNETHVFLHDPWNKPLWGGSYGGPNVAFTISEFLDLWSYFSYWSLYVSPWTVNVSLPSYVKPYTPFQIVSMIEYPQPPPNVFSAYPASSCNASIILPANLSLAPGENPKKTIDTGYLQAGTVSTVNWTLVADSSPTGTIDITVEGIVSGSVWAHDNYTSYSYTDRIGAKANFTASILMDNSTPTINTISRTPETNVQPNQEVKITANITDNQSGIQTATLFFTTDNEATWENRTMNLNQSTTLYEATIPGQQAGTWVKFKIFACDRVGNNITLDGTEPYFTYQIMPEFQTLFALQSFVILSFLVIVWRKYRSRPQRKMENQKS
jgi:predicted double-glycine peptidase